MKAIEVTVSEASDFDWKSPFEVGEIFTKDLYFDVESIKTFARLAMDDNPLHLDEEYARSTRFGGLIACGAHTISWSTAFLAGLISSRCASLGLQFDYTLRRAILADEKARAEWQIESIIRKESLRGYIMELNGRLINSTGQDAVIIKGKSLIMPESALAS